MRNTSSAVAVLAFLAMLLAAGHPASAFYHPQLGRFLQRDPLEYVDGTSLYEYEGSLAVSSLDASGQLAWPIRPPWVPLDDWKRKYRWPPYDKYVPSPSPPVPVPPGTPVDLKIALRLGLPDLVGAISDQLSGKVPDLSRWGSGRCAELHISGLANANGNVTCSGVLCLGFEGAFRSATGCKLGDKECIGRFLAGGASIGGDIKVRCPKPTCCRNQRAYSGSYPLNASATVTVPPLLVLGPPGAVITATVSGDVTWDGTIGECQK